MPEIKPIEYGVDDDYDACGNTTIATLSVNHIKIPLCRECLNELIESAEKFKNTIFCYQCDHFIMSEDGWRYGGGCKKKAKSNNDKITAATAHYSKYFVDCMNTCKDAILKNTKPKSKYEYLVGKSITAKHEELFKGSEKVISVIEFKEDTFGQGNYAVTTETSKYIYESEIKEIR